MTVFALEKTKANRQEFQNNHPLVLGGLSIILCDLYYCLKLLRPLKNYETPKTPKNDECFREIAQFSKVY